MYITSLTSIIKLQKSKSSSSKSIIEEMMHPETIQWHSWPFYNTMNSPIDQDGAYGALQMDSYMGDQEFSSFNSSEDSCGISSDQFLSTIFSEEFDEYWPAEKLQVKMVENITDDMEEIESYFGGDLEDMCRLLDEDQCEGSFPSCHPSMEGEDDWSPGQSTKSSDASMPLPSIPASLILPGYNMEIDSQLGIQYLLKGYGESLEMEQRELAEVIIKCLIEKSNPVGQSLERLAFNLFQSAEKEGEYLKQESSKNFEAAFKAFYQIFPYGRFAHFTANLAILEGIPHNTETLHIVDLDIQEGAQWPPLIEAVAWQQKALKITTIRTGEGSINAPSSWDFEETKRRLCHHARSFGLNLRVEEVGIEDLVSEIKKIKKRGREREWLAFNCMFGLPHMGRGRNRSDAVEFLRVAKEFLTDSGTNKGIITIANGDAAERLKSCPGYSSFFEGHLNHYQALYESMELNFPDCFANARIAMESLFVNPFVSSLSWLQKWEEVRESSDLYAELGLKGLRLSQENLMEAKEMVKEGKSAYTVRIQEHKENEMVLEWRGTPLVQVSTWK